MAAGVLVALLLALLAGPTTPAFAKPGMVFGIEQDGGMASPELRNENLTRMQGLGAKMIRLQLRWDEIAKCDPGAGGENPRHRCYDWSVFDATIRDANARGMQVLLSIHGTPKWEFGKDYGYTGSTPAQFDRFVKDLGDFTQAAATHYRGGNGLPRVDHWTIWNEPNGSYFWSPRRYRNAPVAAQRYAGAYNVAARRLKAVDPTLLVAPGPLSSTSSLKAGVFLEQSLPLLQKRRAPIDAWAHNPYERAESPLASTMSWPEIGLGNIEALIGKIDQYAVSRGRPIWITEFAYETTPDTAGITEEQQARWLSEAQYVAWMNPRVDLMLWYALFDDGEQANPAGGFQSGLFSAFWRCPNTWCPKAAAGMNLHPLWVSASEVQRGQAVTIWAQGRQDPAKAKVYYWTGGAWQAFQNTPLQDGTLYLQWQPPTDTWVVACDVTCGPVQKIAVR